MNPKLTNERLSRRALVYVRQSTIGQLTHNRESRYRQYELAQHARELGFRAVDVIDEDLGRSGSGLSERPGFQRLVAEVCSGEVGAVLSLEASRLARNGRDWHHLIELCGLAGAVVVDLDGVYDPGLINDRLLLGLKGTMSEFELSLLRQRSAEAIRRKASRGELRILLPVGLCWTAEGKIDKDPDRRIQQALELVFAKLTALGSARQVLLWLREEQIQLPAATRGGGQPSVVWKLPVYNSVRSILSNPAYAGAYAFGKTEARTAVVNGRARQTVGHLKPRSEWTVLLRDHHPGYISWEQYERNQALLAANAHMKSRMEPKAARGGRALLSGLLRCRRCGRMLHVAYSGIGGKVLRYHCRGAHINHGSDWCISFGGLRVDRALASEVLQAIGGDAVEAALAAAERQREKQREQRQALELEAEQARYEARLAERRYQAVDPDNRLVAAELEARWNGALRQVSELDTKLDRFDRGLEGKPLPDKAVLLSLAQDLPSVWNSPTADMRLKQRIVRILVHEIVADVDEERSEIVLLIHWTGGRHSELRVKKNATGQHRRCTSAETIAVLGRLAGHFNDAQIATTLNRLGLRTGAGNSWNQVRVASARSYHQLPAFDPEQAREDVVTLDRAAQRLGLSPTSVRRLIKRKVLPASQVVAGAPWQIPAAALESEAVQQAVQDVKNGPSVPRTPPSDQREALFS